MPYPAAVSPLAAAAQPDWWARGIAILSLLLTLAGFALALVAYRRSGARVFVRIGGRVRWWHIYRIHQGIWLEARVINRGLAPIQVTSAGWLVDGRPPGDAVVEGRHGVTSVMPEAPTDSPFPLTAEGLHTVRWKTQPPSLEDRDGTARRMRLRVALGSGRLIHSPWIIVNKGHDWSEIKRVARWRQPR